MLDEIAETRSEYDVDVLIVYEDGVALEDIIEQKEALLAEGKSVTLQRAVPEKLRYKELIKMEK